MKIHQIAIGILFIAIAIWFFGKVQIVETYTGVADSARSWF